MKPHCQYHKEFHPQCPQCNSIAKEEVNPAPEVPKAEEPIAEDNAD